MPKLDDALTLNVSTEDAARACLAAISELGWQVVAQSTRACVAEEVVDPSTSATFPVNLAVRIVGDGSSRSVVLLSASIVGYGRIHRDHLARQLNAFKIHVELAARAARFAAMQKRLVDRR